MTEEDSEPMFYESVGKYSVYARYGFSHIGGYDATLSSGEKYSFDAVNMHGVGVGGSYEWKIDNKSKAFVDLSLNEMFGAKVSGSYRQGSVGEVDLNGLTVALNVGLKQYLTDRSSVNLALSGFAGARKGFAASVNYSLSF